MCKAMASEGTGSIVGKGSVLEEQAAEQPSSSIPGQPQVATRPMSAFQPAGESVFEVAADLAPTTAMEATQPPVLTSLSPPVSASLSGLSASSVSTELVFMQSSTSSAISGHSITAGLQEAMQQMRLQSVTAPGQLQPPGTHAAAPSALPAQALHLMGRPRSSHDSGDLAQMMGQAQQQVQEHEQTEDGPATLFFAKVPRTAGRQQIEELFAQFGEVVSLNLFAPYEHAPTSKGCGLVVMRTYADAASAIAGLDNYKWEGMHSAMVVKLMPPQRQRQEQQDAGASGGSSYRSPGQASSSRLGPAPLPMTRSNYASGGQMRMVLGVDVAPPGCAPDAYKLFVGNIPRAYSEPDLLPIFDSIGPVRELVVLRDRATQESKGSAFVWYATGSDADKAQAAFNMQLVLQNRSGASSRPLVVRRATPTRQGSSMGGMPGGTVGVAYLHAQMQQTYAVGAAQGARLGVSPGGITTVAGPSQQGGYSYSPGMAVSAGAPGMYFDTHGVQVAMVPQADYLQQQQQTQQQHQAQQMQQQLWQQQQQQQAVHGQAAQAGVYGAPVLLSVSEAPAAGYAQQVLQVQQGSWQPQQQQQTGYVAAGFELGQVPHAGSMPASGALNYGGPELSRHVSTEYIQQPQQGMGTAIIMSSMPQAVPTGQQMSASSMVPQAGHVLAGSSLTPATNLLLSGSAGSSASSSVGPLASYQQYGNSQHQLIIPLTAEQLSVLNPQLQNVMAMSGTSITAEHNYACGSLALNMVAASQQQLNVAWQIIQGLLGQQGGPVGQVAEGML